MFYSLENSLFSLSKLAINIIPIDENSSRNLYELSPIKTTLLLIVFYYGFVMFLMSAVICVYIDEYRLTIIDMGKPKLQKNWKLRFIIWLDVLGLFAQDQRKRLQKIVEKEEFKDKEKVE